MRGFRRKCLMCADGLDRAGWRDGVRGWLFEERSDDRGGALNAGVDREEGVVVDVALSDADNGVGEGIGLDPRLECAGVLLFPVELGERRHGAGLYTAVAPRSHQPDSRPI